MSSNEMSDQEVFENSFHHFVVALRTLSSDAATQCLDMDDYNAPYEIQSDTTSMGLGILRLSAHYLSWEKAGLLVDLVAGLRRLPPEALSISHMSMTRHAGCFTAMSHPAWEPLRGQAAHLLKVLDPEIQRNIAYFHP